MVLRIKAKALGFLDNHSAVPPDLQGSFCNAAITYLYTSASVVTLEEASPFTGKIDLDYFLGSTVYQFISYRLI